MAVVVVVVVTAFNDWSKERQFRGLKKHVDRQHTISVVRDAQMTQLAVADIVVGDICVIKYGNLPAISNRSWVAECSSMADLGFFLRRGQATRFPSFSFPSFPSYPFSIFFPFTNPSLFLIRYYSLPSPYFPVLFLLFSVLL